MSARDVEIGTHLVMPDRVWYAVYKLDDGSEIFVPVWAWLVRVRRLWMADGHLSDDLCVATDGLESPDMQEGDAVCSSAHNFSRYERCDVCQLPAAPCALHGGK